MTKLVPFTMLTKKTKQFPYLSDTSVVVDSRGAPLGFIFGRDTFISHLTAIDEAFEKKVSNQKEAYANPAGKLIDTIEEHLPLNSQFVKELKSTLTKSHKTDWLPLAEVKRTITP